jgi:hypothetical protein
MALSSTSPSSGRGGREAIVGWFCKKIATKGKLGRYQYNEMQGKFGTRQKLEKTTYLGERIGGAVWYHATRGGNRILLGQARNSSNQFFQVLCRKITGDSIGVV